MGVLTNRQKGLIESYAWDATVGAGNDSEHADHGALRDRVGHEPTGEEIAIFDKAWERCLQEMAQP